MKKLLGIVVLCLLFSGSSYASEKKFLLCKDKFVVPEKMAVTDFKNNFFPEDGEVLTITYYEKITKLWSEFSHMIQFTLIDYDESYKFQYPKNVSDASTPSLLNFKKKTFMDPMTGDTYKFIKGSLNKITLEGSLYYKRIGPDKLHAFSKTKDYLNIRFKCNLKKPKI